MLYLRDGSLVSGKLTSCDDEPCVVDKRRVPLADIVTIELRAGVKAPAAAHVRDVVLTNGKIHDGKFLTLNLGVVETDAGDVDRRDVALIVIESTIAVPEGESGVGKERRNPPGDETVPPEDW